MFSTTKVMKIPEPSVSGWIESASGSEIKKASFEILLLFDANVI